MKKIAGILGILLALTILLVPANVFAATDAIAQNCKYDVVKWQDNPDSAKLYLNNWGKTPITAMSRLAGITLPINRNLLKGCEGICAACNDETGKSSGTCPTACNASVVYGQVHCCCQWGISTAFANKSWAGNDDGNPRIGGNDHPLYKGNSDRLSPAGGGDWGISGCSHSECKSDIWCLTCNADKDGACRVKK